VKTTERAEGQPQRRRGAQHPSQPSTASAEAPLHVGLQPAENVQEVLSLLSVPEHELREQQVVCSSQQHVDEGQQAFLKLGGTRLLEPSARGVEVLRAVVQYTRSQSTCIRLPVLHMATVLQA
jgi:hypothetical protein